MNDFVARPSIENSATERRLILGPLEVEVMEIVWASGATNVRAVSRRIRRELAYTTVMTTLDRLYKKGMLEREMTERAFVYSPKVSRGEWDRQRAGEMMSGFLAGPVESRDMLLSCLVEAVGTHDALLLDELERKVQRKREELAKANQR